MTKLRLLALAALVLPASVALGQFDPANPFAAPSTLPFQAPAFDRIHDDDTWAWFKMRMAA